MDADEPGWEAFEFNLRAKIWARKILLGKNVAVVSNLLLNESMNLFEHIKYCY